MIRAWLLLAILQSGEVTMDIIGIPYSEMPTVEGGTENGGSRANFIVEILILHGKINGLEIIAMYGK